MLVDVQLSGSPVVVDDLDDGFVLQLLRESEIQAREADLRRLRLAGHWAKRHTVTSVEDAAHWTDADDREVLETIGAEGTPWVAAGCVVQLATALGVSARTAMQLICDALDLEFRLPHTNAAMLELRVAPWRARRIARLTHGLSREAAAWVDARLAAIADTAGPVRIDRLVTEAIARFDPERQAQVEDAAQAAWGVRLDDYTGPVWAGTSRLEITGDTPTVNMFYDLVCAKAHDQLDPTLPVDAQPSLEHRKVAALGLIAQGAGATSRTKLYLHLGPQDLSGVGEVERFGALSAGTIRDWLGTDRFTLQPVLDLARTDAVDQHDPPVWMRELVILRDRFCVHPYCDRPARDCDLDHVEAYVEMDDGGPPGQTRPDNLAPLCRRHHRAKTHHGWTYARNRDGSYTWTSPHGDRLTVDSRGIVTR